MATHNETGKKGEQLASDFLISKGFEIVERNFRWKRLEIDIVAKKDALIVFVEVKTKTNTSFGMPEAVVTAKKSSLLIQAGEEYVFQKNHKTEIRFDIISVEISKNEVKIYHIEDAFY